jgi:hypothetical protein
MRKIIAIIFLAAMAAVSAAAQTHEARTVKYEAKDIVLIKAKLRYTMQLPKIARELRVL